RPHVSGPVHAAALRHGLPALLPGEHRVVSRRRDRAAQHRVPHSRQLHLHPRHRGRRGCVPGTADAPADRGPGRGHRGHRLDLLPERHGGMIRIGIIGYGYWGPNLVRNFVEARNTEVVAVADLDTTKLESLQRRFPTVRVTTDFHDLLSDPSIDAIAIATPVSSHFQLGMAAVKAGKHLWLEKPMTET